MEMLLTPEKTAVENIYTESRKVFPDPSIEVIPLTVGKLLKIPNPTGTRLWDPQDISGWTIRAAIGQSFLPPIAGTFTLSQGGLTTAAINYDATAADIEAELDSAGIFVTATEIATGYFKLTFNAVGTHAELTSNSTDLAPLSVVEVGTLIQGDSDTREVQTIRLMQSPAAYTVLSTDSDPTEATVTVLATGGTGLNHKIRITFDPLPYDGRFSITVGGDETALLAFDASEEDATIALEALASVGTGNVAVFRETVGQYLVSFQGTKAETNMGTITVDDSALMSIATKSGSLDLRTAAIQLLMEGQDSVEAFLEIEGTPPAGTPQKLYRQPVTIVGALITPGSLAGPTPSEYVRLSDGLPWSSVTAKPFTDASLGGNYAADSGKAVKFGIVGDITTAGVSIKSESGGTVIYAESTDTGTGEMMRVLYGPAGTTPGLAIAWNGKMKFPLAGATPTSPATPVAWLDVMVNGFDYQIPLYW